MSAAQTQQAPRNNSNTCVSLISKSSIRYEGTVFSVDEANASITLKGVRVFGTEDRQVEKFIPPSDKVFDYIVFKKANIKEMTMKELKSEIDDPAILAMGEGREAAEEVKEEPKPKEKEEVKEQEQEQPKETKIAPRRPYNNRQNQSRNKYYHRNGPHPGDANYLKDRHTKATDKKEEEEQGEFDYVTATNKFEEEKEQAKETITEVHYNKSDFFDTLTTDTTRTNERFLDRSINNETFGAISVNKGYHSYNRYGRRNGNHNNYHYTNRSHYHRHNEKKSNTNTENQSSN